MTNLYIYIRLYPSATTTAYLRRYVRHYDVRHDMFGYVRHDMCASVPQSRTEERFKLDHKEPTPCRQRNIPVIARAPRSTPPLD